MTITGTQMFGIVMGSIPGFNLIASIIKFIYYNSQESVLQNIVFARASTAQTARKVDEVARNTIPSVDDDVKRLKWCSLLQIIPLIGIYFAWTEKKLLERINAVTQANLNPIDREGPPEIRNPQPVPAESTGENRENFIETDDKGALPVVPHPKAVITDPAPPVDPYPALTQAREEFLIWLRKNNSVLGHGEYNTLINKVNTLSQDLPKRKITLHYDQFNWGYSLFYVEKPGEEKYMPIKRLDGVILYWQNETPNVSWPLKDPQDNSYFIPEITVNKVGGTHSGSEATGGYLCRLIRLASDKTSSSYRILEGLTGYAEQIQRDLGNSTYKTLREKIPSYPDLPDLEENPFPFF